uniref:Enoyl reductase (ER) domain-containing protein n=1 Tax=Timema genevievae TaxID=629358 RepID=A0A7R9KA10_TIMGE|nr:unnamed protein product [Timema genevievae]
MKNTLAYHGMIQAAKLSSGETVLIHAGHTPIGQTAIAFALHIGSTVFTTVTEIVHKEFLMKRFPRLKEKHILSLDNNIDISLMRETQGKGVNVLINCLCGSKLHSSLRCISECGRFVQLGITDMEENTSIGNRLTCYPTGLSLYREQCKVMFTKSKEIDKSNKISLETTQKHATMELPSCD